jgi:hypothetical protein
MTYSQALRVNVWVASNRQRLNSAATTGARRRML